MKKEKVKKAKLNVQVTLQKHDSYHFVNSLSNVFFPYQPYKQQIQIVAAIQKSILKGENALIQSPTGTGKTLCLLIGALSSLVDSNTRKKIFYLTRTHSQISQVVSQFKKTSYQCNLNIIASREHLCINHNLQHLKGKHLQKACEDMCSQKLCTYRDFGNIKLPKQAMDLQQFRQNYRKQLVCPYFYSKQLTQKCELTILPFNYFLDWNLFQKNSIDIKDSVVIFDQAHNIDSLCQQGSDIRMTADLLFQTIAQLKTLIKAQSKKFLLQKFRQKNEECQEVQQFKQQLEKLLNKLKLVSSSSVLSKQDLLHFLQEFTTTAKQQGVDLGNYDFFISRGKKIGRAFMKKQIGCQNLQLFLSVFQRFYDIMKFDEEFQKFAISLNKQQLLFRCLDASMCFARLVNAKPRTIILSSGTLGDLNSWQKNLKISFPHKISAKSFITDRQLYAQIKSRSQNGVNFNFGFQNKQNQLQYEQIVKELKILQNIITGGIVVAFSTYLLLQKTLKYCSLLSKKVYFQTKGGNVDDIYSQYQNSLKQSTSFMFIVIKGRFSEGINFQGELCRCLVVIGIPFLPLKDPAVVEKMKYIQNNISRAEAEEWYSIQSFKALNQTLGRAIRNKNDYAVILLFDQRYSKEQYIKKFSNWFSKCLRTNKNSYTCVKQFLKQSPWINNQITENKPQTKNKKQPTLCQRLQEFSTPNKSKIPKRKLKLVFQSNQSSQKQKKNKQTILKEISVAQDYQVSYKEMKLEHFEYFMNFTPKLPNNPPSFGKQSQQQTNDSEQKEGKGKIIKVMSSFGKYRNALDF